MPLPFPPVVAPPNEHAQAALNALQPWRESVEGYIGQLYGRREHLLMPSDFACVDSGPWPTTVHHNGLCLPSLYYHWLDRPTAYAFVAHSAYVEANTQCEATVTLAWIPRATGLMQFDVYLGQASDGSVVQTDATSIGEVAHSAPEGHWTCAHVTLPTPPVAPGAPMVLTLSAKLGTPVDLVAASVSIQPRMDNA